MARRFFRPRLLPIVMVVGTPLLALKGFGLVRDAQAAESTAPQATMQDYQASPASDTGDDGASTNNSAAEVGVLTSLAKRRTQLDNEEQNIAMRESLLSATEKRVDDKIAMLKQLQAQIQQLLAQRDSEQEKQIVSLVKTYSAMKPKDAARIFNTLDDSVLVPVAQEMKPDVLGPILANMQASQAQKLTVELADRLHVPDPQVAPEPAPPAPQAQAAPSIDPSALAAALAPETAPPATAPAASASAPGTQAAAQPTGTAKPAPGPQAQATPAASGATKPAPRPQAQAPQSAPAQPAAKGG